VRLSALLLMLLLASLPCLAAAGLPGDADGDATLTAGELHAAILDYLDAAYMGGDPAASDRVAVSDAAFIYTRWDGHARTVTDSTGTEIVLETPLRRVVVFNAETLETLRSLGFPDDRIVAVDKYALERPEFFPEFLEKENIGSVWSPDYEKVLSVSPDAVFLYATSSSAACDEIEQKLAATAPGIRILRFDCFLPESYPGEIAELGSVTGREEEAAALAAFYSGVMDTVGDRTAGIPREDRVSVYFENWKEYKSCGPGSGYQDKIEQAGGKNIFDGELTAYPEVDPEAVIVADPDVVIKLVGTGGLDFGGYGDYDEGPFAAVATELANRPGWAGMNAVANNRVHIIHSDIFGGPQHFIGIAYLATWFYPDRFPDLDPEAIHRQYLEEFQPGVLTNGDPGVFAYP
jgi:iron complex transport system substrate-binding protein